MTIRPAETTGDILPVKDASSMASGAEATALLALYRLRLLTGDWWEEPSLGCDILELLRENRITSQDNALLISYLTSYILETPGVLDLRDIVVETASRHLHFTCTLITDSGKAELSVDLG